MDHWDPVGKNVVILEGDAPKRGYELALQFQRMGAFVILCSPHLRNCVHMGVMMTKKRIRDVVFSCADIPQEPGRKKLAEDCVRRIDLFIQNSDRFPTQLLLSEMQEIQSLFNIRKEEE